MILTIGGKRRVAELAAFVEASVSLPVGTIRRHAKRAGLIE
jgi:hypothetical protein